MTDTVKIILSFVLSFAVAFATTPFVKKLAVKIGAIDIPKDARRIHKKPTPLIGGLAIFAGFLVTTLVFGIADKAFLSQPVDGIEVTWQKLTGILIGVTIMVVLGIFDDKYNLPAKLKFIIQIIAAIIPVAMGVRIDIIYLVENSGSPLYWLSYPITVLWIVGLTNAVNLIDGLDGLAAGVSAIASLSVFCVALTQNYLGIALLTAALVGSCFGFLPYNFNPASIFMGDTGSTFLGFVMACISVMGFFKTHTVISFIVPFIAFGIPIFDTSFAILRRLKEHRSIMSPDRGHLHHRLIDRGLSQRQAVLVIYAICILLGAVAVMCFAKKEWAFIIAGVGVIGALVLRFGLKGNKKEAPAEAAETENDKTEE